MKNEAQNSNLKAILKGKLNTTTTVLVVNNVLTIGFVI